MDFALILVVLTALSGAIWGAEVLWRRAVRGDMHAAPSSNIAIEYSRSFFPVLLLVLVVRSFLYEPFRIPSGSMIPTLLVGDFIFVNKYVYGLRLPVLNTRIIEIDSPQRGDVMVFRLPSDPRVNYIKRLVGLPGDTVVYENRRLYINGEQVPIEVMGAYDRLTSPQLILAEEQLGEVSHQVLLEQLRPSREGRFAVPEGYYFLMGDNRDNSQDSRYVQVGFVPEENIVGKAVAIWLSWDFPGMPQWTRMGSRIN